jgi:hypothetical protein
LESGSKVEQLMDLLRSAMEKNDVSPIINVMKVIKKDMPKLFEPLCLDCDVEGVIIPFSGKYYPNKTWFDAIKADSSLREAIAEGMEFINKHSLGSGDLGIEKLWNGDNKLVVTINSLHSKSLFIPEGDEKRASLREAFMESGVDIYSIHSNEGESPFVANLRTMKKVCEMPYTAMELLSTDKTNQGILDRVVTKAFAEKDKYAQLKDATSLEDVKKILTSGLGAGKTFCENLLCSWLRPYYVFRGG